jgi:NADH-quinone oxidoreductase subunit L
VNGGWFLENAWLIPVIPAAMFVVILLFGKRTTKVTNGGAYLGVASMFASLFFAIGAAVQWIQRVDAAHSGVLSALGDSITRAKTEQLPAVQPVIKTWTWWQSGGVKFPIGIHVDGLAICLLVVVAFISTLVQIYSLEYLRGDRRFTHYFAAITLFSAAMLAMVEADNMLAFLLGWEIMGLCSFLLIGHWWEDYPNARAAVKAFLTVRVGDIGLLVGIAIVYFSSNSWITANLPGETGFSIHGIGAWALSGEASHTALLWAAVALMIGCIGKSGQFPLHTWLPDAMAGPTPVSSLLHSSTMVVAGVYLGARLYPVFYQGFSIGHGGVNMMVLIGGVTIVIAALLAFVQVDIKKVLAYSTVSQLGYMMMGLGAGAWTAAVFHVFTHAFFKACLFLGAGSVSHSGSHHSFDMKKDMGGLRKKMPITFATFVVASAALAGIFPLAGFWSKDEILVNAGQNGYTAFLIVGLVGAGLTAAYMTRCIYLTFLGTARGAAAGEHYGELEHVEHDLHALEGLDDAHATILDEAPPTHGGEHHPHESPPLITVPLVILAALAAVAGFVNLPWGPWREKFLDWVEPRSAAGYFPELSHAAFSSPKALLSVGIALVSFAVAGYLAVREFGPLRHLTRRSRLAHRAYRFLWNKYFLDTIYEKGVVGGLSGPVARAANWINQRVIDGIVNGAGTSTRRGAELVYKYLDQDVIDGAVNLSGKSAEESGQALRPLQSGKVQQYGALLFGAAAIGVLILVITV